MDGTKRREEILKLLIMGGGPISGTELSRRFGVSRQIIVQDIALLRAVNQDILSTPRGYVIYSKKSNRAERRFKVSHTTCQMEDELFTIVDHGGRVKNVIVSHVIYGEIVAALILNTRSDVKEFIRKIEEYRGKPLKDLSDGIHWHLVEADTEEILDQIESELETKGYLIANE